MGTRRKQYVVDVKCTIQDTRAWVKGRPDSPGWYEASVQQKPNFFRWWDGERWSVFALRSHTAQQAAIRASIPFVLHPADTMYWREVKV